MEYKYLQIRVLVQGGSTQRLQLQRMEFVLYSLRLLTCIAH